MDKILLSHGSGGKLSHDLIKNLFLKEIGNPILKELADSALLDINKGRIAFTTDSYVVKPLFFAGGDIGKLAVCGTVNDLAVMGAEPLFISCGMIMEEGLDMDVLAGVVASIKKTAAKAGVKVVTGDTKVVEKGSCDKLFINTSGIGTVKKSIKLSKNIIRPGDVIIINGPIGDHGIAVLAEREHLNFKHDIKSDCAPLNGLIKGLLKDHVGIKFMRDPTRGGLATTLNEIANDSDFGIVIDESGVPVNDDTRAVCEILGFDPLYIGNEGKVIVVVSSKAAKKVLAAMKKHPLGKQAKIIGEVTSKHKGRVCCRTTVGGMRIADMLVGEQLPRIC